MTALFEAPAGPPPVDPIAAQLMDIVQWASDHAPRTLQTALGPSEIGEPCARRTTYKLLGNPEINPGDPWPSYVGTAVHAKLAEDVEAYNRHIGRTRYLTEQRVQVTPGIAGTSDLTIVDVDDLVTVDYKIVSKDRVAVLTKDPGPKYRVQLHAYARGWHRAGLPIQRVALAAFSKGWLKDLRVWSEPYQPQIVDDAIERHHNLLALINDLQVEDHPDRYQHVPATPGDCYFCPFWRGGDQPADDTGCPGR